MGTIERTFALPPPSPLSSSAPIVTDRLIDWAWGAWGRFVAETHPMEPPWQTYLRSGARAFLGLSGTPPYGASSPDASREPAPTRPPLKITPRHGLSFCSVSGFFLVIFPHTQLGFF